MLRHRLLGALGVAEAWSSVFAQTDTVLEGGGRGYKEKGSVGDMRVDAL